MQQIRITIGFLPLLCSVDPHNRSDERDSSQIYKIKHSKQIDELRKVEKELQMYIPFCW